LGQLRAKIKAVIRRGFDTSILGVNEKKDHLVVKDIKK
jgi:hypothetical protein